MKRDPDLCRELLLRFEASEDWTFVEGHGDLDEQDREYFHMLLLCDEDFLCRHSKHEFRMTAAGHSFCEATRSPQIWKRARVVADEIGGASLMIIKETALALVRRAVADKLGFDL